MKEIVRAFSELDEAKVLELVKYHVKKSNGEESEEILSALQEGMLEVGKMYEREEYFIADLIMAGLIFKNAMATENLVFYSCDASPGTSNGVLVIGTVEGDMHDIGKDIFGDLMRYNGYTVYDIGVDCNPVKFVSAAIKYSPDIIGLSGILTGVKGSLKNTITALRNSEIDQKCKIVVGGGFLTAEICSAVGADGFAASAKDGLVLCNEWMRGSKS